MISYYAEAVLVIILLLLLYLYEISSTFRYYFRFFLYYTLFMFNAAILLPVMASRPFNVRNLPLASTIFKPISTLLGLKWHLKGKEYLEKDEAYIIVANHQSSIDILGMFDIWPVMDKCTVVAKKELFYAWPFGLTSWLCGLIFIDRVNLEKARIKLKEATDFIKLNKIKLWVFPEGTRRNTGDIHPFKKGAFHMAIDAQIPILPVVFSSYYFLNSRKKIFDHGKAIITTLPPISTTGMTTENMNELMEKTRKAMLEAYQQSNKELREEITAASKI